MGHGVAGGSLDLAIDLCAALMARNTETPRGILQQPIARRLPDLTNGNWLVLCGWDVDSYSFRLAASGAHGEQIHQLRHGFDLIESMNHFEAGIDLRGRQA